MKRHSTLLLLSLLVPFVALAGIPEGYYKNADGKKKAALKAAMHDIIQPKTVYSYGGGSNSTWSGFYVTDRTSDGYVIDRYTDSKYWVKFSSSSSASYANAPSGMNIEHSFPKSWWGGGNNTSYKDLYNLMPSESGINSDKSNYAMGKVTNVTKGNGFTKVGKGSAGGSTVWLWEPADQWKGDFARDYFYMVTAYSHLTWTSNGLDMLENNDWPTMQQWAYKLLLQWAKQDPVDDIERKRNDDVYSIQKNRNPFVDFPYLAEYIWGDSIDFAFSVSGSSSGGGGGNQGGDDTPQLATLVDCSMKSGFGPFFIRTYEGCDGEAWTSDATYGAKATAYNLPGKESDEYLMVSLDLTHAETATLTFDHATGYNKEQVKDRYFQVLVSDNYHGVPEDATWHMLDVPFPPIPTNSFSKFVSTGNISLNAFCGDRVTLAFRFISSSSAAYCWEVRDVKVTAFNLPDALPLIVEDDSQQTITYDMVGRRVPWNTKGIVIRNGKKVLQR